MSLKKNYLENIGLDHFYTGFNKEEIKDLKNLSKLPFCVFSKVKSGKDSWQGLYWSSTSGSYFEMLEKPSEERYQLGFAFSANTIQYFDIRKIKTLFKNDQGLKTTLRLSKTGKPWFTAISSKKRKNESVFMWGMHYFFNERTRKTTTINKPSLIERFIELEVKANPKILEELKTSCYWAPFSLIKNKKKAILNIQQKDKSYLKVICHLDPKTEYTSFISMTVQASPFQTAIPKMKSFSLTRKNGLLKLSKK
jgi:hypothetical protein